jgi:hypothetical protein
MTYNEFNLRIQYISTTTHKATSLDDNFYLIESGQKKKLKPKLKIETPKTEEFGCSKSGTYVYCWECSSEFSNECVLGKVGKDDENY